MAMWTQMLLDTFVPPVVANNKKIVIGLNSSPWVLWYNDSIVNITAPATGPTSGVRSIAFSPDGNTCVIATASALFRYDTSGTTATYLGAMSSPPSWSSIKEISFNAAGTRLLVIDSAVSPYAWIYDTSTWTTVTAPTLSSGSLSGTWDGTAASKIIVGNSAPLLKLFDTSGMGASATQPGTQPTPSGGWTNVAFSPNGDYFAASGSGNPAPLRVWKMTSLSAPLTNPGTMPHVSSANDNKGIRWNPAGTKFALCEPFGTSIYNVSGTTVALDTTINYNVIGGAQPFWRSDGAKLYLTQAGGAPRFAIYTVSGWTKDTNPATQPATDPSAIASNI